MKRCECGRNVALCSECLKFLSEQDVIYPDAFHYKHYCEKCWKEVILPQ